MAPEDIYLYFAFWYDMCFKDNFDFVFISVELIVTYVQHSQKRLEKYDFLFKLASVHKSNYTK